MLETTSFIIFSGLILDVTLKSANRCIMSHSPFRGYVSSAVRLVALKLLPATQTKRYVSYPCPIIQSQSSETIIYHT